MNQQQRLIKLRLSWFKHFTERSQNVAKTCRYFGISRHTYYFWRRRYQNIGVDGLYNHSRRPKTSPWATKPTITKKIVKLRRKYRFGPVRLSRHLLQRYGTKISAKTIYVILKKAGWNKLPSLKSKLK